MIAPIRPLTLCGKVEEGMAKTSRDFKASGAHQKLTKSTAAPDGEEKEECVESIYLNLRTVCHSGLCK